MKIAPLVIVVVVILTTCTISAMAQTAQPRTAKSQQQTTAPEGMTKEQGDEILKELKAIHQLLRQRTPAAQPAALPASDKVQMNVRPGWYSLGRDDAPVTIVEFGDYQCPFCRKFHSQTFADLKKNYIDSGKARFVSRDLPLELHPNAPGSAVAARCAGDQNKFWEMRDLMLASNADLSRAALVKYAEQSNLDMTTFSACLNENKHNDAIQKDMEDAGKMGIRGTPSFVVGRTAKDLINGVRIAGAVPYSAFEKTIEDQLNEAPSGVVATGSRLHLRADKPRQAK